MPAWPTSQPIDGRARCELVKSTGTWPAGKCRVCGRATADLSHESGLAQETPPATSPCRYATASYLYRKPDEYDIIIIIIINEND